MVVADIRLKQAATEEAKAWVVADLVKVAAAVVAAKEEEEDAAAAAAVADAAVAEAAAEVADARRKEEKPNENTISSFNSREDFPDRIRSYFEWDAASSARRKEGRDRVAV